MGQPLKKSELAELRKVPLQLPEGDKDIFVEKCIEMADRYVTKERWPSHQSVYKAVLDSFSIDYPVDTIRLLCGFTAGGGFTGGLCGALCGGAAALGFIYGSTEPMHDEVHKRFMEAIFTQGLTPGERAAEVVDTFWREAVYNYYFLSFRHKFGHTDCRKLIEPFRDNPVSRKRFGCCRRIVGETAGLAARTILTVEKGQLTQMGENVYSHLL